MRSGFGAGTRCKQLLIDCEEDRCGRCWSACGARPTASGEVGGLYNRPLARWRIDGQSDDDRRRFSFLRVTRGLSRVGIGGT
jgi:hypothetical protein